MEFDKSKVYTVLNADELKVGSKVILADTLGDLKSRVEGDGIIMSLDYILSDECRHRFTCDGTNYALAYLVEEPEGLKWTDLKVGDVIRSNDNMLDCMITEIDRQDPEACHIRAGTSWLTDKGLKDWKKVE